MIVIVMSQFIYISILTKNPQFQLLPIKFPKLKEDKMRANIIN